MENTKIKVEFNLFGDTINFDKVKSLLNINPTRIRKKEDCKIAQYMRDSWQFSTGYKDVCAISIPFEELVDLMHMKFDIINDIKQQYSLKSNIVIVVMSDAEKKPEFVLTNKCIKFAADTNSEIHFDNYFLLKNSKKSLLYTSSS